MRPLILASLAVVGLAGFTTGQLGTVDLNYNFDSIDIDSGPDTFELFERGTSEVSLSSEFSFRGGHSLHIQDYIENSSFPEFQGYFPTISGGTLEIGFALMTPNPEERFNIALAGDQHFSMAQNGIGFWLLNDSGTLRHMSDSIPKRLFDLTPFRWYWFDIKLDVTNGEYSMNVIDESGAQIINIENQKHPTNSKKSNLKKYSFIGDLEDQGNADFYIDEFILRTDHADSPKPLIAPGRRSLFVDLWDAQDRKNENINFCLPPKLPYDFLDIYNTQGLSVLQDNVDALRVLLSSPDQQTLTDFSHEEALINGISKWAQGCLNLREGQFQEAIKNLELAYSIIGYTPATQQSLAIAYANIKDYYGAKLITARGQQQWHNDVRWLVLSASIGFMSSQLEDSETALTSVANSIKYDAKKAQQVMREIDWLRHSAVTNVRYNQVWNEDTEVYIIAEQYYFSLLWQSRYREAENYAKEFAQLLTRYNLVSPLWIERAGDAALFSKDLSSAEKQYTEALKLNKNKMSALQKLSDVYFLQNKVDKEREIRESIFGALNYE